MWKSPTISHTLTLKLSLPHSKIQYLSHNVSHTLPNSPQHLGADIGPQEVCEEEELVWPGVSHLDAPSLAPSELNHPDAQALC